MKDTERYPFGETSDNDFPFAEVSDNDFPFTELSDDESPFGRYQGEVTPFDSDREEANPFGFVMDRYQGGTDEKTDWTVGGRALPGRGRTTFRGRGQNARRGRLPGGIRIRPQG